MRDYNPEYTAKYLIGTVFYAMLFRLDGKINLERLTKEFKKDFCCNGCVVDDKELGRVIQLQGDQREKVKKFIVEESLASKKNIKVHGI